MNLGRNLSIRPDLPIVDLAGAEPKRRMLIDTQIESLLLFIAKALAAFISFVANIYLAKILGAVEFGRYSFVIATVTFLSLSFDFGYFASGARLLAIAERERDRRGYISAIFVIGGILSALFIVLIIVVSRIADHIFRDKIGEILLVVAIVTPGVIAPLFIEQMLKATHRIYLLATWNVTIKVFLLATIVVFGMFGELTALTATIAYLSAEMVGLAFVAIRVGWRFTEIVPYLREIAIEQRRFGKALYVGKSANLISYNTDKLLLAYFWDATAVGYYSLAMSLGSVIPMFSQSVAASGFRGFAHLRPISATLQKWNLTGIMVMSAVTLAGGNLVVRQYLGPSYSVVGLLLLPAIVANGFQGAYQPYNSWLLANGFGVELRRFLFVVASNNLLANLILIPISGSFGAATASIIGMATYVILAIYNYRQKLLRSVP